MTAPKKLIEVALPLEAINIASAREKSIRLSLQRILYLRWIVLFDSGFSSLIARAEEPR